MRYDHAVILTDLDGTLLNSRGEVSAEDRAAIRKLPVYARRQIFAVGDYWNDMELLQAADIPCCPDNAIPEIKAVCRHILPSHNDSPIAWLIREVIPSLN